MVSHARIYQHVWQVKKRGGTLDEHLRTRGKRNRKRGAAKDSRSIIVGRGDIEQRPVVVEQRKRFGDLEMDTIIGNGHRGAILTINDRATGMLRIPCARCLGTLGALALHVPLPVTLRLCTGPYHGQCPPSVAAIVAGHYIWPQFTPSASWKPSQLPTTTSRS